MLSDPEKRSVYDETGIIDDGADDEGGFTGSGDFDHWDAYFRAMFPTITLERIEKFAESYRGSEEEKGHVLDAYKEHNGNAVFFFFSLPIAPHR